MAVALLSAVATASAGAGLTDGLVLHYTFDNDQGSTAIDSSGSGFNGTMHGTTTAHSPVRGLARHFDGSDDYVGVPHNSGCKPTAALTVSAWLNLEDTNRVQNAVSCTEGSGYSLGYSTSKEALSFAVYRQSGGWATVDVPGHMFSVGEWIHAVGVYTGSSISMYLNGKQIASHPASGSLRYISNQLIVGGEAGHSGPATTMWFQGWIDEVRIYNRGLSSDEVTELYEMASGTVLLVR